MQTGKQGSSLLREIFTQQTQAPTNRMLGRSSGNHGWLLANASACVSCGFRLRNAATQAISFEWKPGFRQLIIAVFYIINLLLCCAVWCVQPRLQSVLKDPDAVQLVHMLFSPLAVIIDSCRDDQGHPVIASNVEAPLLTADACHMLDKCLHPRQAELWRSLGRVWTTPRL